MRFREALHPGRSAVIGAGWIPGKAEACRDRDYRAYACVYLTAGSGRYRDERGRDEAVAAGDLIVVFPGLRHSYGPAPGGTWSECWIGFRGPLFAAIEAEGLVDREHPVLHPGTDPLLTARFDAIATAVDRAGGDPDPVLAARVHLLLAEISAAARTPAAGGLVARARAALEADLRSPLDLPRLAAGLGVGYDTLRRAFHAELGTTPGHWRQLRRIERAKEMLVDGAKLERIAEEVGYCDRFFFARQFKQVVGQPPAAWRREFLGSQPEARRQPAR
jgi:AraC-like DNA-binding protein